jgi:hypothetical protein
MDRQYNDQKIHGQAIQRPKETWTGNKTTKRKMDRQYNEQKKHGLPVHFSFGRCIVCPCFFWSLYCLSMFLLVFVLPAHNMDRQYNDQKKHGQAIQRPPETWTGNTMTKRNIVEKGQALITLSSVTMAQAVGEFLLANEEWIRVQKLGKSTVSSIRLQ